ncbi:hypothetical protein [Devosia sp.]|uniref:hypothetical protein n=1 Tax=Devosia sp. TaxID=1871048 RepID=UPI0032679D8C
MPDPLSLEQHFALIEAEHHHSLAAPLSARRALLVAILLDHYPDRVFAAHRHQPDQVFGVEDMLAYRAELGRRSPAMAAIFALGSGNATLRIEAVKVPIADYSSLGVEDFMVSLYNGNSVQRVMLYTPGHEPRLAHDVLSEAIAFWRA